MQKVRQAVEVFIHIKLSSQSSEMGPPAKKKKSSSATTAATTTAATVNRTPTASLTNPETPILDVDSIFNPG
jgi:hypothetical protein